MPTWKGALPDDDLWAMAYYVRSLIDIKGTPEADARREKLIAAVAVAIATASTELKRKKRRFS